MGSCGDAVSSSGDVTKRRQAKLEREELLTEVQRRAAELDATIASMADGLITYDTAGEIVRMNSAAESLLGYSQEDRKRPLAEQLELPRIETPTGEGLPLEAAPPLRALHGQTVLGAVLVLHPPTGRTIWISSSAAPIRTVDSALLGAVVTFTDITPLHELQVQREDMLRTVSHDLRSPLTVEKAQGQLLLRALDEAGLYGRARQSAEAIVTSTLRMDAMIQELVETVRLEAGQLPVRARPVDLHGFVLNLTRRLAGTLEVGRIRVAAPEDMPPVLADPDHLERILTNLLSNALKYSTPGTPIEVTLSRSNGRVLTSVSDRGPGVPPDELPHIFDRYYRARRAREGREALGLGLYVAERLVEAQDGQIWAESRPGVGSTFAFSLPLSD